MIEAITEHHAILKTTDEHTQRLTDMIHNMGAWLNDGLITKDTYVHIHDILRDKLGTENYLLVGGYRDERLEKQEYSIRVIEFPVKADGDIRSVEYDKETDTFYLLTKEEAMLKSIENSGGL